MRNLLQGPYKLGNKLQEMSFMEYPFYGVPVLWSTRFMEYPFYGVSFCGFMEYQPLVC